MWFSLFATVLILAVTFYQGLQGLFSAMINCVLTFLAAALAFGFYEDLYQAQLIAYQPDHGRAIALVGIFVLSLLALRFIVDGLIKGNQRFPIYVDRAGGGVFGFITAMLIIGVLAVGFQMLPFDSTFLGFSRYTLVDQTTHKEVVSAVATAKMAEEHKNAVFRTEIEWPSVKAERHNLWLNPDGFTVAAVAYVSRYALAGRQSFADLNPDFLDYLHHVRDGLGREPLAVLGPGAVSVKEFRYLRDNEPIYRTVKAKNETGNLILKYELTDRKPGPGKRWMAVTVQVREKTDAAQDRTNLNFTASQIRLLARDRKDGPVVAYPLVGINEDDPENAHRLIEVFPCQDIQYKRGETGATEMRLLFEVPDASSFRPWMIQYKLNARAEILPSHDQTETKTGPADTTSRDRVPVKDRPKTSGEKTPRGKPPVGPDASANGARPTTPDDQTGGTSPPSDDGTPTTPPPNPNPPDRVHGVNLATRQPFFDDKLPFRLTNYAEGADMQRSGSKLIGARSLTARLSADWEPVEGSMPPLETFDVPENMRLLHLTVEQLHPQSWLGNVMGTAVNQVRNIYLIDSNGRQYMPVGKYAIATIRGETIFELTYLDEIARGNARMPGFEHIRFDDLKGQYAYVFLFHLPPGTRVAKFHTGRTNIDLTQFNLVAPK